MARPKSNRPEGKRAESSAVKKLTAINITNIYLNHVTFIFSAISIGSIS